MNKLIKFINTIYGDNMKYIKKLDLNNEVFTEKEKKKLKKAYE